jgi:general secretion pathway protein D
VHANYVPRNIFHRAEHLKTFFSALNPSSYMKRLCLCLGLTICLLAPLALHAQSAGSLYKRGRDAEAAQKYETAYELFKEAYEKSPKDIRYRTAFERLRFYAAAVKVHRGQLLRDGGRLEDALAQFEAAAAIDPSMDITQQEIRRTRQMIDQAKQQPASPDNEPLSQGPISEMLRQAQGPVDLQPISDVPITLKMTEDARMLYETIGKLAGINVLFDPDYSSRRIHIELNGVSLQDALQIVAFESKTFWRPVTANTIFVAQDNPTKRKELEQNVIKTFYLSNVSQTTDLQDIVNTMRAVLQIDRVQQLASQNAVIVRGTPDQIALAEKLIDDIDKAKPEVVVDVAIMQVSRDHLRDLGITPPPSVTVALQSGAVATVTPTTTTPGGTTTTTTTPTTAAANFTFNTFKHLGSQSYSVSAPQATASFLFSDSDSKIIQNPQLRAVSGEKATLKIGDRVPVATGSFGNPFQASSAAGNFSGLVNTQFQYLDVGVNVELTPTVHANREVTLKVSLDISSVTRQQDIGGITQPVIGQRKVDNVIRLREGEINILGGILEDQDVKSWSGLPGLGNIPLFRYLFAKEHIDHSENEIVFVLIPHIVRGQEITPLNRRAIDIGSGNTIEMRRNTVKPQSPAQQTAPQPGVRQQAPPPAQQPFVPPTQMPPVPNTNPPQGSPPGPGMMTPPGSAANPAAVNPSTANLEDMQPPGASAPATAAALPAGTPSGAMPQGAEQRGMAATAEQPATAAPLAQTPPVGADTSAAAAGTATVRLDPPLINQPAGTTAAVNVMLDSATPVHDFSMELKYDAGAMQLINVTKGGYLSGDGQPVTVVHREEGGVVRASAIRAPSAPGIPGQGAVLTLVFLLNKPGDYPLTPVNAVVKGANGLIPASLAGQMAVRISKPPAR